MRSNHYTVPAIFAAAGASPVQHTGTTIKIPSEAPEGAGVPLENFVSFSIEFSFFPDFAGNLSHPNTFSNNLLDNIATYSGSKPYVRVGGSSQDNALFVESQKENVILVYEEPDDDQPANLTFGPSFFESYQTWPDTTFVHGFNLKANTTEARDAVVASVPYACETLRGQLLAWELGNEPDLYAVPFFMDARDNATYDEKAYVTEWLELTRRIANAVEDACPDLATDELLKWYAPSFAASPTLSLLDQVATWEAGLNTDDNLKVFASHHYQGVATNPGVTLAGTLMNHSATIASVDIPASEYRMLLDLPDYPQDLPFILAEGNSLARQGAPGLSNSFGAALWGVDANLLYLANNIARFHMHQGTNYRYQSWQPVNTDRTTIGTKAPYYGNIAVAAFLGDLTNADDRPQVVNLPLKDEFQAAYASFVKGQLENIMLINLHEYNATEGNPLLSDSSRGSQRVSLQLPQGCRGRPLAMQRLIANGSDAVTGVTFDGYSYNYELDNGKPVLLSNVTRGETAKVDRRGMLSIDIPDSSAVLLKVEGRGHGHGKGGRW